MEEYGYFFLFLSSASSIFNIDKCVICRDSISKWLSNSRIEPHLNVSLILQLQRRRYLSLFIGYWNEYNSDSLRRVRSFDSGGFNRPRASPKNPTTIILSVQLFTNARVFGCRLKSVGRRLLERTIFIFESAYQTAEPSLKHNKNDNGLLPQ